MYQDGPDNLVVETKYGKITFCITQKDHIYLDSGRGRVYAPLTLGSKQFHCSAHLYLRDGQWVDTGCDGKSTWHACEAGTINKYPTKSQDEKMKAAVYAPIIDFVKANPQLLQLAQLAHVHNKRETLESKRAELMKQVEDINKEIAELEGTLVNCG